MHAFLTLVILFFLLMYEHVDNFFSLSVEIDMYLNSS